MKNYRLSQPELMQITDGECEYKGGSQEWYADQWKRMSGCGPTSASGIVWYIARTRPDMSGLCEIGGGAKDDFINVQEKMFSFVTPGKMGVNTTAIFTDGITRYAESKGLKLRVASLDVTPKPLGRIPAEKLRGFLTAALEEDAPVAFLNLSNGMLRNLESWHWVLITALEADSLTATICDQGKELTIDLARWLGTAALGGGFVSALPAAK